MHPLRLFLCLVIISVCGCKKYDAPATPSTSTVPTTPNTTCTNITKADAENIAVFPADNMWNTAIANAALDSRSTAIIDLISVNAPTIKADFGSGIWNNAPIGIPYTIVCGSQTKVAITYRSNGYDGNYGSESDAGPFPIPLNAPVEGNGDGDSHVIVVDIENKKLYELYNASPTANGWGASSGAQFDLTSNTLRPDGWTSADAAGLPIFPGLVRYDEIVKGEIDHPIRFTLRSSKVTKAYIDPARHKVNGTNTNSAAPTPMGMRIRLKTNVDISSYSATNKIILSAMKKYGLVLADIGSDMYISGAPDARWNDDDLRNLGKIKASDFEVVQMTALH
ncbi:MAG: hypothetical protein V4539_13280 [Bacteroidota bacterium]